MISSSLCSMIDGLMISDAGLRLRGNPEKVNANFYLTSKSRSLCKKVLEIFQMHGIHGVIKQHSLGHKMKSLGYTDGLRYETKYLPFFTRLWKKWYHDGVKIVPPDVVLTEQMLAYWLMGDGSNSAYGNSIRITLCTDSFDLQSQKHLVQKFRKIGIYAHIEKTKCNKNGNQQYRIIISRAVDVIILINKVEQFVLPEFKYKISKPTLVRPSAQYFTKKKTEEEKKLHKAEYERERYKRNQRKILAQQAEYYAENRDEIKQRRKLRKGKNRA